MYVFSMIKYNLEAETSKKVYIIAEPEFGENQGHSLVIFKALYGLGTSRLYWHGHLIDCLKPDL